MLMLYGLTTAVALRPTCHPSAFGTAHRQFPSWSIGRAAVAMQVEESQATAASLDTFDGVVVPTDSAEQKALIVTLMRKLKLQTIELSLIHI